MPNQTVFNTVNPMLARFGLRLIFLTQKLLGFVPSAPPAKQRSPTAFIRHINRQTVVAGMLVVIILGVLFAAVGWLLGSDSVMAWVIYSLGALLILFCIYSMLASVYAKGGCPFLHAHSWNIVTTSENFRIETPFSIAIFSFKDLAQADRWVNDGWNDCWFLGLKFSDGSLLKIPGEVAEGIGLLEKQLAVNGIIVNRHF